MKREVKRDRDDDDGVGLHVFKCRVDIFGTNCNGTETVTFVYLCIYIITSFCHIEKESERKMYGFACLNSGIFNLCLI